MLVHPSKLSLSLREALGFTEAECLYDPELHAGPTDAIESPEEEAARVLVARDLCFACPVMSRCLNHALAGSPESGVWAGLTADELASINAMSDHDLDEVA